MCILYGQNLKDGTRKDQASSWSKKILPNNLSCTMLRLQCITVLLMSGGKIHSLINIGMSSDWTPSYKVRTLLRMV